MDRQLIKSLIDTLAASDLAELTYSADGATLHLVKARAYDATTASAAPPPCAGVPSPSTPCLPAASSESGAGPDVVHAPAYGIVHLQRSPGAPPLVAAGDGVVVGQVLCLIEAMKVFTELRAERSGTVADILVETGQEVDAGQPLFRMA